MSARSAWIMVAVVLAGGCTASPAGSTEVAATVVRGVDTATLVLPLDPYVFSPAEFQSLARAEQVLTRSCLNTAGFSWELPAENASADTKAVRHTGQWGLTDEARAKRYGYRATPDEWPEIAQQKAIDRQLAHGGGTTQRSPEFAATFTRCQEETRRALYRGASPEFDVNYPSVLAYAAESRTWSDSRVITKINEWRTCTDEAGGFTYEDPLKAGSDPKWRSDDHTEPASEREKEVAATDASCNNKVGLSDTAAAVDAAYQNDLINQNRQRLAVFAQSKDTVLRNVTAVLQTMND